MNTIVYIGTYNNGSDQSKGIYSFSFDKKEGRLTPVEVVEGILNPSFLVVSKDGNTLYSVSEVFEVNGTAGGSISAFNINSETGKLSFLNTQLSGGACPCHIELDPSGKYVFVSNYMGGNFAVFPLTPSGQLGEMIQLVQHNNHSSVQPERQEGPHVHAVAIPQDNNIVFAADLGNDEVASYHFDQQNGNLNAKASIQVTPGSGPRHMAFHPNGKWLFLINELNSSIYSYKYDRESGRLNLIAAISSLPQDYDGGNTAADIHVHPNGRFLYVSNRGHDSVVLCSIHQTTGDLTLINHISSGGAHPRNFSLDPEGEFMLVANKDSNSINAFKVDPNTGMISAMGCVAEVPEPVCVQFLH